MPGEGNTPQPAGGQDVAKTIALPQEEVVPFHWEKKTLYNHLNQLIESLLESPPPFYSLMVLPPRWLKRSLSRFNITHKVPSRRSIFFLASSAREGKLELDWAPFPSPSETVYNVLVGVRGPQFALGLRAKEGTGGEYHGEWFLSFPRFDLLMEAFDQWSKGEKITQWVQEGERLVGERPSSHFLLLPWSLASLLARWKEERPSPARVEGDFWAKVMWKFQSQVVRELDERRLLPLIARLAKETFHYSFFQILFYDVRSEHRTIAHIFQKNDTPYGGDTLQLILEGDWERELFKSQQAQLITKENYTRALMNPRLWEFMGIKEGVAIPLTLYRRAYGVMILLSRQRHRYDHLTGLWCKRLSELVTQAYLNAQSHTRLQRLAIIDGLTRVFNHRFFVEQLRREWKRARRYQNPLTLLMLDIDHFKHYNDNWGHLQGDKVLAEVAELIRGQVREVDWVCRYGGEEFAIILPETDLKQGMVVAEKIRQAVSLYHFSHRNSQPLRRVTVSIGVAENTSDIDDPGELVNRADTALYFAKRSGRNRCEAFRSAISLAE